MMMRVQVLRLFLFASWSLHYGRYIPSVSSLIVQQKSRASKCHYEKSFLSSSPAVSKTHSVTTRKTFFTKIIQRIATAAIITSTSKEFVSPADADVIKENDQQQEQQEQPVSLSNDQLAEIVRSDIVDRQFLVTGKLTRSIYLPTATFTDEIDTYEIDKWIVGTQRLFVGDKSYIRLVNDTINIDNTKIEFRFDEDLMFNIPLVRPVVSLTGTVILTRDPITGLIASYREIWDQDIWTVLKNVKI